MQENGIAFSVSLDNHKVSLNEDLTQTTVLLDATGSQYAPLEWQGAGPGGHHRQGMLLFPGVKNASKLTLVLVNVGGAPQRVFEWSA